MKIGTIFDEIGPGVVTDWLPFLEEHNVRSGEIRTIDGLPVHTLTWYQAGTYAKVFHDASIEVTALAAGLGKRELLGPDGKLNQDVVKQERKKAAHLTKLAEIFGTNNIRAFGGFRQKDMTAMWPHIIGFFRVLLDSGAIPDGFRLCIENEPATGISRPSHVLALQEELDNDQRIAALVDVGNIVFDVELVGALKVLGSERSSSIRGKGLLNALIEEELEECKDIIALAHLKNLNLEPSGMQARTVPLDKGMVDFQSVINTLRKIELDMYIDLETHRLAESQELSEGQRHAPGGEGYGNPADVAYDLEAARKMAGQ